MTDDERAERIARARSSHEAKAEEVGACWQAHAELYNHAARLRADASRLEDEAVDWYALWDFLLGVRVTPGAAPEAEATPGPTAAAADDGGRRPGRQGRRRKPAEKPGEGPGEGGAG